MYQGRFAIISGSCGWLPVSGRNPSAHIGWYSISFTEGEGIGLQNGADLG